MHQNTNMLGYLVIRHVHWEISNSKSDHIYLNYTLSHYQDDLNHTLNQYQDDLNHTLNHYQDDLNHILNHYRDDPNHTLNQYQDDLNYTLNHYQDDLNYTRNHYQDAIIVSGEEYLYCTVLAKWNQHHPLESEVLFKRKHIRKKTCFESENVGLPQKSQKITGSKQKTFD